MASVLIVDDSSFERMTLQYIIESDGHEVVGGAVNCEQGVAMYVSLRPEVVTLDFQMEGGTGIDALKEIMQLDSSARVIIISGSGNTTVKDDTLELGAVGYLSKPVTKKQLLSEIKRVLND